MEDMRNTGDIIGKRKVLNLSEWRSTQIGMWAWVLQRFAALFLILFITLHLVYPYQVIIQTLMVFFACFHGVLGLRVILLDIGTRISLQRLLFGCLITLGIILLIIVLKLRIYY